MTGVSPSDRPQYRARGARTYRASVRCGEPFPLAIDGGGDSTGPGGGIEAVLAAPAERPATSPDRDEVVTLGQLARLPASVGLREAARALGIGRTSAYHLARTGQFPCPLIKVGALYRVPTAGLLRLLGLTAALPPPADSAMGDG